MLHSVTVWKCALIEEGPAAPESGRGLHVERAHPASFTSGGGQHARCELSRLLHRAPRPQLLHLAPGVLVARIHLDISTTAPLVVVPSHTC